MMHELIVIGGGPAGLAAAAYAVRKRMDALFISHDHPDHIRCAGIYQRKFGIPLYVTRRTVSAYRNNLGRLDDVRYFESGDSISLDHTTVHTIPTAHDAADGVGFVVENEGKRLGILTDLGHPFPGLSTVFDSLDAAYIESNYDDDLLDAGGYPEHLKARIRGPHGHLSNDDVAGLLKNSGQQRPKWLAVAHLSEENNRPELAIGAQHEAVGRDYPVHLAPRHEASEVLTV